ncbi:Gfo/Idh/MocA family protein [Larkinella bovis]|uniref:Gfo/Idh/MocA family protein n=1 Tax=Larkinella bovis TaxID=683041 RepID=A0ABW0IG72_9BACT
MAVTYRIVVVGLGSIGLRHARLLQEREDVALEVLEISPETATAAQQVLGAVKNHTSFEAMLATKPNIVWLATPTPLHASQSIQALEAGVHVFCEKPMTATREEARQLASVVDRTGLTFGVGFYLHFWRGMQLLKGLIDQGKLGNILHLHARVGTYITLVNSLSRYQAYNPGSLFFDYAHQMDLVYWLLKKRPTTVYTPGFQGGNLEFSAAPNVADIMLEYDAPLIAHIHLNYVQMPQRHCYEITGDEGWAVLDFEQSHLRIGNRQAQAVETVSFQQERDDIFRAEHTAFLEAVAGHRQPETSAADGLISTAICEAILQSWQRGQKQRISYE